MKNVCTWENFAKSEEKIVFVLKYLLHFCCLYQIYFVDQFGVLYVLSYSTLTVWNQKKKKKIDVSKVSVLFGNHNGPSDREKFRIVLFKFACIIVFCLIISFRSGWAIGGSLDYLLLVVMPCYSCPDFFKVRHSYVRDHEVYWGFLD